MGIDSSVHRISTAEYTRMVDSGGMADLRVELLDGLLVDMSPQGHDHAQIIQSLIVLFAPRADLLHVQLPLELEDGWVPEPDVALAIRPDGRHPTTALLVVEVAASGVPIALRKATAYARANVDRYWIVDVAGGRVLEHTEPGAAGYGVAAVLAADDPLDAHVDGVPVTTVATLLRSRPHPA